VAKLQRRVESMNRTLVPRATRGISTKPRDKYSITPGEIDPLGGIKSPVKTNPPAGIIPMLRLIYSEYCYSTGTDGNSL